MARVLQPYQRSFSSVREVREVTVDADEGLEDGEVFDDRPREAKVLSMALLKLHSAPFAQGGRQRLAP